MAAAWQNWSGGVTCAPTRIATPTSEAEVIALIRAAGRASETVRVAGTGHSFTPLCATDGTLLSLDGMQGLIAADPDARTATFQAGTKLHAVGEPLRAAGFALENMGDIDRQALAGAIGTGTHGTGPALGSLSTQVVGLRLVLASGDCLDCSAAHEPAIFNAARVSFGALGVMTQITLRVLPAYRLHERTWVAEFEECMAEMPSLIRDNRHCEFFWSPSEDACAMKTLNPTDATQVPPAPPPETAGRLTRYVKPERIDWSDRIFPSERTILFNEMEFAVPAEHGPACMRELRELMRGRHPDVAWPVEYRTLRADDIPASPAYGRETVTISIHQAAELSYQRFFTDAEALFRRYQGRPHWGKLHWYTARDLHESYPQWDTFLSVRERLDPDGRFLNTHLRQMLLG